MGAETLAGAKGLGGIPFAQRGRQRCELDTRHGEVSTSPRRRRLCQVKQRAGVGFCATVPRHRRSLEKPGAPSTIQVRAAPSCLLSAPCWPGLHFLGLFWGWGGKGEKKESPQLEDRSGSRDAAAQKTSGAGRECCALGTRDVRAPSGGDLGSAGCQALDPGPWLLSQPVASPSDCQERGWLSLQRGSCAWSRVFETEDLGRCRLLPTDPGSHPRRQSSEVGGECGGDSSPCHLPDITNSPDFLSLSPGSPLESSESRAGGLSSACLVVMFG